jgi:hypothetical protein
MKLPRTRIWLLMLAVAVVAVVKRRQNGVGHLINFSIAFRAGLSDSPRAAVLGC